MREEKVILIIILFALSLIGIFWFFADDIRDKIKAIYNLYSTKSTQIPVSNKLNNPTKSIRNILIIGETGSGKSALANVLSGKEKFAEKSGLTSETKNIHSEDFEWNGTLYRVIDTIGTADTANFSNMKIISTIRELLYNIEGEIIHILFVLNNRFTDAQVETFKSFQTKFPDYTSCITIVRSNFPEFEDKNKCEDDINELLKNKRIAKVIKNYRIIHIDNPRCYSEAKRKRESSRQILLNHLEVISSLNVNFSDSYNFKERINADEIFEIAKNNIAKK